MFMTSYLGGKILIVGLKVQAGSGAVGNNAASLQQRLSDPLYESYKRTLLLYMLHVTHGYLGSMDGIFHLWMEYFSIEKDIFS